MVSTSKFVGGGSRAPGVVVSCSLSTIKSSLERGVGRGQNVERKWTFPIRF